MIIIDIIVANKWCILSITSFCYSTLGTLLGHETGYSVDDMTGSQAASQQPAICPSAAATTNKNQVHDEPMPFIYKCLKFHRFWPRTRSWPGGADAGKRRRWRF